MRNRESQFPVRETVFARHSGQSVSQIPKGVIGLIILMVIIAGIWWFARTELKFILDDLQKQFLEPLLSEQAVPPVPERIPRPELPPAPKVKPKPVKKAPSSPVIVKSPAPVIEVAPYAGTSSKVVPLLVGRGFLPAGFKIGAVPRALPLSDRPDHPFKRLPGFRGRQQKFGVIEFANGLQYLFAFDMAEGGYQLFLDRNRNGDLRDDGAPLLNQGSGVFATNLNLPLDLVSGVPALKGDYNLWIFTNKSAWKQNSLRFYAKTQLSSRLQLGDQVYTAYLADNHPLDGDYRNDGISIDLNRNGKIEHKSEYFAPDTVAQINGRQYRFHIR